MPVATWSVVPRRGPHPRRSLRRRQPPPAPYPTRVRAGPAAPATAVVGSPRATRGHGLAAPVRRVSELLWSGAPAREGAHDALRTVSWGVRGGLDGFALARVRSAVGPADARDAGPGPRERPPGVGDGLRVEPVAASVAGAFARRRVVRAFARAARAGAARVPRRAPGTDAALPDTGRVAPA